METLKLISVRLDRDVLRMIDTEAKRQGIFKRSAIINQLLKTCVTCASPKTLWSMITTNHPEEDGYVVDFKIKADKLREINPFDL